MYGELCCSRYHLSLTFLLHPLSELWSTTKKQKPTGFSFDFKFLCWLLMCLELAPPHHCLNNCILSQSRLVDLAGTCKEFCDSSPLQDLMSDSYFQPVELEVGCALETLRCHQCSCLPEQRAHYGAIWSYHLNVSDQLSKALLPRELDYLIHE